MASLAVAGSNSQKPDTYAYLCHLQEMKQWMETVMKTSLPSVEELEERLRNGVMLVHLGKIFLPSDPLWSKAYDLDESRYKSRGLDFRHTDNVLTWIKSLNKLGLPPVFYPDVTDIYEQKNIPKLVYCIHALSHYLKKEGKTDLAVSDLYGNAEFSEKAVQKAQETLRGTSDIPSIDVVEDLVEEELQYQGMDVLKTEVKAIQKQLEEDSANPTTVGASEGESEEPPPPVPKKMSRAESRPVTDNLELIYDSADTAKAEISAQQVQTPKSPPVIYGEVNCSKDGVTAVLYSKVDKEAVKRKKEQLAKEGLTALEAAVRDINQSLDSNDPRKTMQALKNDAADLPHVFNEPEQYHNALLAERNLAMPENALVVYNGMTRGDTERLLSSMSAGAFLIRRSGSDGSHVFSFRNQTGIKHWKIDFRDGLYFLGDSTPYTCLSDLIDALLQNLRERTKLAVYPGVSAELRASSNLTVELSDMLKKLHQESGCNLSHEQIRQVVLDTNDKIKSQLKAIMSDDPEPVRTPTDSSKPPPPAGGFSRTRPSTKFLSWNKNLILSLNRMQAEAYLRDIGCPGSYLVRPSESQAGDYSISFRTSTETRHWKVQQNQGCFTIHPQPNQYDSLESVIKVGITLLG